MAEIKIDSNGGCSTISVDGQPLANVVTRIAVEMEGGSLPVVTLDLAAFQNELELSDARLKIGGIEAPEELERAILAHLSEKYAPKVRNNITVHVNDITKDGAGRSELLAGMERVRAQIVSDFVRNGRIGSLRFARGGLTTSGSVVQSVAADLLKLPVREMHGGGSGGCTSTPAGITRTATDGERSGRMAWVPGARS